MKIMSPTISKGIVFAGCSFTWGQGLYYYSNLPTLKEPGLFRYDDSIVTNAQRRYMAAVRYPRLVANYFNTFEIVSNSNGGSDSVSLDFLRQVFGLNSENPHKFNHLFQEPYSKTTPYIDFNEIEYIIFQTSQPDRNKYYFTLDGKEYFYQIHKPETHDVFYQYLIKNNMTFEDVYADLVKNISTKVKEELQFYESKGIKTLLLHWENEYVSPTYSIPVELSHFPKKFSSIPGKNYINHNDSNFSHINDTWMSDRIITISYKDKTYKSIRDLMNEHRKMEISHDYIHFITPPEDGHPSLECHKVLANAIIQKIENNTLS